MPLSGSFSPLGMDPRKGKWRMYGRDRSGGVKAAEAKALAVQNQAIAGFGEEPAPPPPPVTLKTAWPTPTMWANKESTILFQNLTPGTTYYLKVASGTVWISGWGPSQVAPANGEQFWVFSGMAGPAVVELRTPNSTGQVVATVPLTLGADFAVTRPVPSPPFQAQIESTYTWPAGTFPPGRKVRLALTGISSATSLTPNPATVAADGSVGWTVKPYQGGTMGVQTRYQEDDPTHETIIDTWNTSAIA